MTIPHHFVVTDASGTLLVDNATGTAPDTVYWLASCSKLVSTILVLIAVQEQKLALDDSPGLIRLCPELKRIPIISSVGSDGSITLTPHTTPITLRMLLTHTAGFSYTHLNKNLHRYARLFGINEGSRSEAALLQPLLFEPGTQWSYGIGIDWACTALTRAYQRSLNDLLQTKLLQPAGIVDMAFVPTASMRERAAPILFRKKDGSTTTMPALTHPVQHNDPAWASTACQYGGSGLYASPHQFAKVLAVLLNDGVSPYTQTRILASESVAEMFTNQIPQWPDFARQFPMQSCVPAVANSMSEILPQKGDPPQGWGLSFFLNLEKVAGRRNAGSAYWCGISNTYYWIDRKAGVAGFLAAQVLPFGDEEVMQLFEKLERQVYKRGNL